MNLAKTLCSLGACVVAMAVYFGIAMYRSKKPRLQDLFMAGLMVGGVVTGVFLLIGAVLSAIKNPEAHDAIQLGGIGGFAVLLVRCLARYAEQDCRYVQGCLEIQEVEEERRFGRRRRRWGDRAVHPSASLAHLCAVLVIALK